MLTSDPSRDTAVSLPKRAAMAAENRRPRTGMEAAA